MEIQSLIVAPEPAVVSLHKWMEQVGVTACTIWRWRKRGWLTTVNIAGGNISPGQASKNSTAVSLPVNLPKRPKCQSERVWNKYAFCPTGPSGHRTQSLRERSSS